MSGADRLGLIGLILISSGLAELGETWTLIVPGLLALGIAAFRERVT